MFVDIFGVIGSILPNTVDSNGETEGISSRSTEIKNNNKNKNTSLYNQI